MADVQPQVPASLYDISEVDVRVIRVTGIVRVLYLRAHILLSLKNIKLIALLCFTMSFLGMSKEMPLLLYTTA
jgi:hypothetical protein